MFGGCIGIVASVVAFSHIQLVEIVTDRALIKGEPARPQNIYRSRQRTADKVEIASIPIRSEFG